MMASQMLLRLGKQLWLQHLMLGSTLRLPPVKRCLDFSAASLTQPQDRAGVLAATDKSKRMEAPRRADAGLRRGEQTILDMLANINLLCSRNSAGRGLINVDLAKVGWRRCRNGEGRPN